MRNLLKPLSAAVMIGTLALTPTAPARADSAGPAIAAGIGGFALGAMAGGALAGRAAGRLCAPAGLCRAAAGLLDRAPPGVRRIWRGDRLPPAPRLRVRRRRVDGLARLMKKPLLCITIPA